MRTVWSQKSVWAFFAIAFGVPWAGWTAANVLAGRNEHPTLQLFLFYTGDFCTIAGVAATFIDAGRPGVSELFRRAIRWRSSIRWWVYAVFLPCAWSGGALLLWALAHKEIGRIQPLQVFALVAPMRVLNEWSTGPFGEEPGWRGFLLPKLMTAYRPLTASVILGVIWGVWHFPLYFSTVVATPSIGIRFLLSTTAFSILMTLLFMYTRGSLLLQMVLHSTINEWRPVLALVFPDIHMNTQGFAPWIATILLWTVTLTLVGFFWAQLTRMPESRPVPDQNAVNIPQR